MLFSSSAPGQRYAPIDALRGAAMLWMTAFHLCFDLGHFGLWRQDFLGDPFWTLQRAAIVSLFLFCAGLGQAVALHQGQGWGRFARRWVQVAAAAALVSLGSWWMFPRSWIYFGVLHGLAVMLVLVRLIAPLGLWLWPLGVLALALPAVMQTLLQGPWATAAPWMDAPELNWLGWIANKPITEDYVPLFPWLGVMCWGMAAGQWLLRTRPAWLQRPLPRPALALALLGRWSLSYYLLHQPLLMGLLMGLMSVGLWMRAGG